MKIGTRLGLAFAILLVMLLGIIGLAMSRLESQDMLLEKFTSNRVPQLVTAHKWAISVLESARHMRNIFILDHDKIPEELAGLQDHKKLRIVYMNDLEKFIDTDQGKEMVRNVVDVRAKYIPDEDEFIKLAEANQLDEAKRLLIAKARPEQLAYLAEIYKLIDYQLSLTGKDRDICVAQRFYDIPPPIIAVNAIAHQAIAQYTATNKVTNSPWAYYKLVNVQAEPFDKSQIVNDQTSIHNAATFFQANSVVETDYTLQNFNGRVAVNGAPTDYTTGTPPQLGFKNVYLFPPVVPKMESFNMGGCMGCHGIAQSVNGSDFSFILAGNTVRSPETPAVTAAAEIARKYHALFVQP